MQKGSVHIAVVLSLVVIGIGVGLYLVQNPVIFSPKASTSVDVTGDFGSTPVSEMDKYPRPNSHIQTMFILGFYPQHWN